jgi:hypothetical protein
MIGDAKAKVRRLSDTDLAKRDMKCERRHEAEEEAQEQRFSYAGSNPPTISSARMRSFRMELEIVDCTSEF